MFLRKEANSGATTQEKIDIARNHQDKDKILFLEDVLLKKEQVLPAQKEKKEKNASKTTTKTTPDVAVTTKKYEIPVQELQLPKSKFFKRKNSGIENLNEVICGKKKT